MRIPGYNRYFTQLGIQLGCHRRWRGLEPDFLYRPRLVEAVAEYAQRQIQDMFKMVEHVPHKPATGDVLTNIGKRWGMCRRTSVEPLEGYYFDHDHGLFMEGDNLFRDRVLGARLGLQ